MQKETIKLSKSFEASPSGRFGGAFKKIMGIIWMLLAPVIIYFLVSGAIQNIGNGTKDINKPIPWLIIITIFTPIALGLMIFGYYSFKGEYDSVAEEK
jgi:hypothetical protein